MSEEQIVPEGWAKTTLGEIAAINPKLDTSNLSDDTLVSFVPMAAVEEETGKINTTMLRYLKDVRRNYTPFQQGDVLFAKITPCMENGKSAVARPLESGIGFGSTEFHVLRPHFYVHPQYLYYFISQRTFRQKARAKMSGSAGQLRVPVSFLEEASFPLPPPGEQQRIVEAIERHFSRLDAIVAELRQKQKQLKRHRASVLKAAVEGTLTAQWRAQHPDVEPASALLQRILRERRARWEDDLIARGRDPQKANYVEPAAPDVEALRALPEGWCWTTVEQLADVGTGATPLRSNKEYYDGGTIPWIKSGAVNADFIRSADEYITEKALVETNTKLFPVGTLILAMYGEGQTRGKVSELMIEAATNQACAAMVFRPLSFVCQPYVKYFLMKNYFEIRSLASGGVQPNLNLTIVKETTIPLPSAEEQKQIIAEVEKQLSLIKHWEEIVEAHLATAQRLRQTILREAFAGRLVPQEPAEEPASQLLERIRAERKQMRGIVALPLPRPRPLMVAETRPEPIDPAVAQHSLWERLDEEHEE
jgi:type I restriction enzyme S subunit